MPQAEGWGYAELRGDIHDLLTAAKEYAADGDGRGERAARRVRHLKMVELGAWLDRARGSRVLQACPQGKA